MAPLLKAIPARHPGARRIVLVPGGELGLVAWHAARQRTGRRYRYACQEVVISYASSARQFVDTARRRPRPWAQSPVLIADSVASLFATAAGIRQLYSAHYPAASVFGFARRLAGGLVVLASCFTDVTEADYDEALTLATAFLSAGAAGVVGARWRVDDTATALFMAIFHAALNGRYPQPALALRAAQNWILDPDRAIPASLPAVLHAEVSRADLADPLAWAGFAYQGQ